MNIVQKILIPSVLILSGCSAIPSAEDANREESGFKDNKYEQTDFFSDADKIEGVRHKVVKQALTGFGDLSELRHYATRKAEDTCYKAGRYKRMLAISERTSVPPYIWENFPRIELTFVCVDDAPMQPQPSPTTSQNPPSVTNLNVSPVTDKGTSSPTGKYDLLFKLKELLDNGALTQEEFEREKKKILSGKY